MVLLHSSIKRFFNRFIGEEYESSAAGFFLGCSRENGHGLLDSCAPARPAGARLNYLPFSVRKPQESIEFQGKCVYNYKCKTDDRRGQAVC